MIRIFFIVFVIWFSQGILTLYAQDFMHPGIFHKESDFARMRQKIAEKAEPWYTTWNNLISTPEASLTWMPRAVETVIRGGTGDNISLMYRDVAAAYQHALIYKISGDKAHGDKAVEILNAWSAINKSVSGNADRYLAAGLNGYQFANAAEMMRDYPGFDLDRFKKYMLNVFFYPMNERFIIGNSWGAPHNDAVSTNYRVNWDICNMNAMLAISILCDNKTGFDEAINYCKSGDGTGNINRAINYIHSPLWGQWEESGRDQGHAVGGLALYELFCEMAWNQGTDIYSLGDFRYRKGAEYVARYNIMRDSAGISVGKYNDLPFTTYSRLMGSLASGGSWYTEYALSPSVRGKYGTLWEGVFNHYARRLNQYDKVQSIFEILKQQPSTIWPSVAIHADTYDTPGGGALTFRTDSGSSVFPWLNMDIAACSITKLPFYGSAALTGVSDLNINGSGTGINGNADWFHFVFQRLIDDGEIVAKITSLKDVNSICQSGLMIREKLNQTSKNIFLSLSAKNGTSLSCRDSAGGMTTIAGNSSFNSFPSWLKLSRTGNEFSAFVSSDKVIWEKVGSHVIVMNSDVYIGLAVSSKNKDTICNSVFENIEINHGNIKPVVQITSPLNNLSRYVEPANIIIKGTAHDIDGQLNKVEIIINDSIIGVQKSSVINFIWDSVPSGTYHLKLKAYDNLGASRVSDSVWITVNPKISKLPWYKFDEPTPGILAYDASGNNLTAMKYGSATISAGKYNYALNFDGIDDYVKLQSIIIHKLSDFSILGWVYLNSQNTWARIFDFGTGTNSYMYLTPFDGTGVISFKILSVDNIYQEVKCNSTMPLGNWYHIAVTLANNNLSIYLNGSLVGSNNSFILRPYDIGNATFTYLGKSQYTADPYLNGKLDDFRFFNHALSQSEIKYYKDSVYTINRNISDKSPLIFPNPVGEVLTIKGACNSNVIIYNTLGNKVQQFSISSDLQEINLERFNKGVYFIRIEYRNKPLLNEKLLKE